MVSLTDIANSINLRGPPVRFKSGMYSSTIYSGITPGNYSSPVAADRPYADDCDCDSGSDCAECGGGDCTDCDCTSENCDDC